MRCMALAVAESVPSSKGEIIMREMLLGDIMHLEGKPFWNSGCTMGRDVWKTIYESKSWHYYFKMLAEEFGLAP